MNYLQAIAIAEKLETIESNPHDVKMLKQELAAMYYGGSIKAVKFMMSGTKRHGLTMDWTAAQISSLLHGMRNDILAAGHITTIFRHVSSSGMQRLFTVGFTAPSAQNTGKPYFLNLHSIMVNFMGEKVKDHQGMRLIVKNGCGYSADDEIFRDLCSFFEVNTKLNPITHIQL